MTQHLEIVSLSSNRLSMLYFSQLNATYLNTVSVSLEHNPWHCNGSLGWTTQCISQPQGYTLCMGWLFTTEMICTSPLEVQDLTATEAGKEYCRNYQSHLNESWQLPLWLCMCRVYLQSQWNLLIDCVCCLEATKCNCFALIIYICIYIHIYVYISLQVIIITWLLVYMTLY